MNDRRRLTDQQVQDRANTRARLAELTAKAMEVTNAANRAAATMQRAAAAVGADQESMLRQLGRAQGRTAAAARLLAELDVALAALRHQVETWDTHPEDKAA